MPMPSRTSSNVERTQTETAVGLLPPLRRYISCSAWSCSWVGIPCLSTRITGRRPPYLLAILPDWWFLRIAASRAWWPSSRSLTTPTRSRVTGCVRCVFCMTIWEPHAAPCSRQVNILPWMNAWCVAKAVIASSSTYPTIQRNGVSKFLLLVTARRPYFGTLKYTLGKRILLVDWPMMWWCASQIHSRMIVMWFSQTISTRRRSLRTHCTRRHTILSALCAPTALGSPIKWRQTSRRSRSKPSAVWLATSETTLYCMSSGKTNVSSPCCRRYIEGTSMLWWPAAARMRQGISPTLISASHPAFLTTTDQWEVSTCSISLSIRTVPYAERRSPGSQSSLTWSMLLQWIRSDISSSTMSNTAFTCQGRGIHTTASAPCWFVSFLISKSTNHHQHDVTACRKLIRQPQLLLQTCTSWGTTPPNATMCCATSSTGRNWSVLTTVKCARSTFILERKAVLAGTMK